MQGKLHAKTRKEQKLLARFNANYGTLAAESVIYGNNFIHVTPINVCIQLC
ncbi:MAG: hypothetical protein LBQ81_05330 [Zoogloeaceae bacterium]|jgi:hypothetical protein|nr:hypothetical protein [Zoogloeaceae bacterium]